MDAKWNKKLVRFIVSSCAFFMLIMIYEHFFWHFGSPPATWKEISKNIYIEIICSVLFGIEFIIRR